MWMSSLGRSSRSWLCTDWVLEIFLDTSRSRSSMFMKSMLPPKFSWYVPLELHAAVLEQLGQHAVHDRGARPGS